MKEKPEKTLNVPTHLHDFPSEVLEETAPHTILIVDDEIDYLELIERYVSSFGYDCFTAENGEQALEFLNHTPCDLVITDMMMPKMNGMELLKRIQNEFPQVATLVLSGYGNNYTFKDIIQAGAYEFLEKPVNKDVLEAKIKRVFREKTLMASYLHEIKTQKILVDLLMLSTKHKGLPELLHDFLLCITGFPWLDLEPKGAVFLIDEHDSNTLTMMASHNLSTPLTDRCAHVSFGHCLCGMAAQEKKIIFSGHTDENHPVSFAGIHEHGHYCVPILLEGGELLGIFTLYAKAGAKRKKDAEHMLETAAHAIAGIIASKNSDERNAEREQRYRIMTDNVLDAIIMMDSRGKISFWNPAATRIFGFTAEEVMGNDLHATLAPEQYRQQHMTRVPHFLHTGHGPLIGKTVEISALTKDGRTIPIELSLSRLKSRGEWQAVAVIRDVTQRKALETERDLLNIKLRQAQKMEAIGTLAGGIAHDFNNILGAVIGFADMAREEVAEGSQVQSDLDRILAAGYRARDLVHQILTFSRQKEEEFFPTQLQPILKESMKLLRATIPANIEIHQDIDPACDSVMADPTQLHQVIMNLCTNAYYAMATQGGHLRIGLKNITIDQEKGGYPSGVKEGHYVKLTVADSGEGIGKEVMPHIFEPYYTTKPLGEGTGLGLSMVHGIIQSLGGSIDVESEPGKGTVFGIYLPALRGFHSPEVCSRGTPLPGGNEHILLVDDEISLLEFTSRKLAKLGYTVTIRTSSVEALEDFRTNPDQFDLVITDLAMPDMTGVDIAHDMINIKPSIPVILTTGFADAMVSDYAMKIGIKKVLSKPLDFQEAAKIIRQALTPSDSRL